MLYALVLAIGRDALPGADSRFTAPQPTPLPSPQRLAPIANIETSSVPTIDHVEGIRVTVPIKIAQVPQSLRNEHAGVATFDSVTGGDFRWFPLNEAMQAKDQSQSLLVTAGATTGSRLSVTLAAKREHARHGYIARTIVPIQTTNGRSTDIVNLSAEMHQVRFNLPTNVDHAGPMRLQRVDDRQWLPMRHNTSGLTLRRDQATSLQLGAGTYELQDPLAPDRTQRFTVPGSDKVEVSASLAPAQDGRL